MNCSKKIILVLSFLGTSYTPIRAMNSSTDETYFENSSCSSDEIFSFPEFNQVSTNNTQSLKAIAVQAVIDNIITSKNLQSNNNNNSQEQKLHLKYHADSLLLPKELRTLVNQEILKRPLKSSLQFKGKILDVNANNKLIASPQGVIKLKDGSYELSTTELKLATFCAQARQLAYLTPAQDRISIVDLTTGEKIAEANLNGLILKKQSFERILFPEPDYLVLLPVASSSAFFWHPESSPNDIHRCEFKKGIISATTTMPGNGIFYSKIFDGKMPKIHLAKSETCDTITQFGMYNEPINSIAYGIGYLAAGSQDKTVKLWDILSGTRIALFEEAHPIHAVTIDRYGRYMASGTGMPDGKISLWDLRMQRLLSTSQLPSFQASTYNRVLYGPRASGSISSLSFNDSGNSLFVGIEEYEQPELHAINLKDPLLTLKKTVIAAKNYKTVFK